ncbi:tetratricopeptide repeat protein [Humitalea rosea]|uniref:Tetratricopeptide repeat protein n=1 Tax=Humitalea rosea TaxID=990373 RepID=A0A2W7I4H4_9PROT|nr:cellulose biosynthesis protein BcsC [Humitalea rosea]PZW40065.1 tetratricopeptide repeat protein [Humitalea rosea]
MRTTRAGLPIALTLLGLPLAVLPVAAQAQLPPPASLTARPSSGAVDVLVRRAERWLDQDRADLAASEIERAQAADPNNPAVLAVVARIAAARGDRDAAAAALQRLRALGGGDSPAQQEAEQAVRLAVIDRGAIEEARRLAREGRAVEAVARYRGAFGPGTPPEPYALEFYQTLAGTETGAEEGRRGLARLAARPGANNRARLANAQTLTYDPATRAEGIRLLAALAAQPDVAAEARRAWSQALGFAGNDPTAVPQMEAFLQRFPDDAEVRRRLETARAVPVAAPDPSADLRREGFARLEAGALQESAARFEAALAVNPSDADALGGLGILRLRAGRPAEARTLLERAIALAPARASQWQPALDGAAYGQELTDARTALRRGDTEAADTLLRRALQRQVEDRTDAETLLGEVTLRRGDAPGAEQRFRAALARRPGFGPAVAGLNQALRAQGRLSEIREPPRARAEAAAPQDTRVTQLRAEAARSPDPGVAIALLRSAVELAPNDPWTRLDLARVLRRQGRDAEGRALVEELAARERSGGDATYAAALYADEDGRPGDAEAFLARIPPGRRSADMARLSARTRTQRDVAQAVARLPLAGPEGRQGLLNIAARPDPTGATGAAVIRALGEAGDGPGAAEAARVAQAANRNAGPTARLALASALLGAGQDGEAMALAGVLDGMPLSNDQRRDVAALRAGIAIRAADQLNEAGEQAQAFERLRPVLTSEPDNPEARLALARLYQGARRPADALRVAEALLARDPRNLAARQSAIEAAVAMGDRRRAEALLAEAQTLAPRDSRVALLDARVARAFGDEARARRILLAAATQRDAELGRAPAVGVAPGAGVSLPRGAAPEGLQNPFQRAGAAPLVQLAGGIVPQMPRDAVAREIAQELAQLQTETASRFTASATGRARSGDPGLDRLREIAVPLEADIAAGRLGGRITATVTPVMLDAGQLETTSASNARRFGSNALGGANGAGDGTATGVGLGLAYARGDSFRVDIGSTPLGFETTRMVGGIEVAPRLNERLRLRVTAERRGVTDSLLSWSGATDRRTGTTWGGVARTGARGQFELPVGPGYIYAGGGYSVFEGDGVADNTRVEGGAGFSYPVYREGTDEISTGVDLVYLAYDQNLRYFTLGHGGYYSPQSYAALNVPLDYRGRSGDFSYRLGATAGYATSREDATAVFPNDPALQARLVALGAGDATIVTRYPGQSQTGFVGSLRADLDYAVTPNMTFGGQVRFSKASDFDETRVLLRLQNRF